MKRSWRSLGGHWSLGLNEIIKVGLHSATRRLERPEMAFLPYLATRYLSLARMPDCVLSDPAPGAKYAL